MRPILREIRAAFRLARVGLHLGWGAATVAVVYPWLSPRWRRALKQRWSRQLLEILDVKLGVRGATAHGARLHGLLVCNHISWLDVFVINALTPAAFVAKQEVKSWPLIGWLCAHTETIFLPRGSRRAARRTLEMMTAHLQRGVPVAFFPEGTTTQGERVLPFHAALFQAAIEAAAPLYPLALRYADRRGYPSLAPAYLGATTLWQSLRTIARADGIQAELRILPAFAAHLGARAELAQRCREAIMLQLGQRPMPPRAEDDQERPEDASESAELAANAVR
jgi:1-acyl-sn-glycerol-3-phosphate acyltransferase